MEFVHDQGEHVRRVCLQPCLGLVEDGVLDVPHEHDVEHARVRDQDVGRCRDHVPASQQLAAFRVLELGYCLDEIVSALPPVSQGLAQALCLAGDLLDLGGNLVDLVLTVRVKWPLREESASRRRARVTAEVEQGQFVDLARADRCLPQPRDLVLDQRVGRVKHERTDRGGRPA